MLTSPLPADVLARAAELRAGGKSWEFAARELDLDDPQELRDLVEKDDDAFQRLPRREVLNDSFAEGDIVATNAADCLLRFEPTEIRPLPPDWVPPRSRRANGLCCREYARWDSNPQPAA